MTGTKSRPIRRQRCFDREPFFREWMREFEPPRMQHDDLVARQRGQDLTQLHFRGTIAARGLDVATAVEPFTVTFVAELVVVPATVNVPVRVTFVSSFKLFAPNVWISALLVR